MTFFQWLSSRSPEPTPEPDRQSILASAVRVKPRVPVEYLPLYTYLQHRHAGLVVLTFEQIESLLGFTLSEAARTERTWWTDEAVSADRHAQAWMMAQRTATPNLPARNVAFERRP